MRSTFPLSLGGTIVRGLEVRFEAGKAVEVCAESGADAVREEMATDEGSSYLGEVALVDGDSRAVGAAVGAVAVGAVAVGAAVEAWAVAGVARRSTASPVQPARSASRPATIAAGHPRCAGRRVVEIGMNGPQILLAGRDPTHGNMRTGALGSGAPTAAPTAKSAGTSGCPGPGESTTWEWASTVAASVWK